MPSEFCAKPCGFFTSLKLFLDLVLETMWLSRLFYGYISFLQYVGFFYWFKMNFRCLNSMSKCAAIGVGAIFYWFEALFRVSFWIYQTFKTFLRSHKFFRTCRIFCWFKMNFRRLNSMSKRAAIGVFRKVIWASNQTKFKNSTF